MGSRTTSPPSEPSSPVEGGVRKRVCKACDRCRLKKSKCDGSSPCSRCKADNAICVFGERKKSHEKVYPKGYVEMLENQQSQLVTGLQELYRRLLTGERWIGAPLKETARGTPLTHDILERLGALKSDQADMSHFEEESEDLQCRLLRNGAGFMQHEYPFDNSSETDRSPIFEPAAQQKSLSFINPFTNRFPPTPPDSSPHESLLKMSSPLKAEMNTPASQYIPQSQWQAESAEFEGMDYNMSYDSPIFGINTQATGFGAHLYNNATGTAINPCLTMKNWYGPDDSRYCQENVFT